MAEDNGDIHTYLYNSEGWRIYKKTENNAGSVLNEEHYIMDGATMLAVTDAAGNIVHWNMFGNELLGRQLPNGDRRVYVYDHLGSVRMVYDQNNNAVGRYEYANASLWDYPFGLVMASNVTEETKEGFTGKEQDEETGLYYFGARYYDAALGRWSAVDPAGQLATPYGYATDPLLYVDPDGELAFLAPILVAAAIGAATSTAVYTATYYASGMGGSGQFWKGAGKAAAFGAVSGAISGGLGSAFAGSTFGQSASFGILSNSASTVSSNLLFGNEVTVGSIAGSMVGGLVSSTIPSFKGVKGSGFTNVAAELGYSAGVGAISGLYSGATKATIDNHDFNPARSAINGAIGAVTLSSLKIAAFGPSIIPDDPDFIKIKEQLDTDLSSVGLGLDKYSQPVFRRGGLWAALGGSPISLGRNILIHGEGKYGNSKTDILFEEYFHYYQAIHKGYGGFLARGLFEQVRRGLGGVNPYKTPGNLEYGAYLFRCVYGTIEKPECK